jgi:transcriptional regulator with XRE-family HTH domain
MTPADVIVATGIHPLRVYRERRRLSLSGLAKATGLSRRTILRAEQGAAVRHDTARLLCEYFGTSADELGLLVLRSGRPTPSEATSKDGMRRRQWLGLTLATPLVRVPGGDGRDQRDGLPAEADAGQLLAGVTRSYRVLEASTPSADLIAPVEAHLRLARRQAARREEARAGTATDYAMVSEAAGLAAWLHADLGDAGAAREHYRLAVRAAERAEHPLLIPYMIASLGHFAAETGDARQALVLVQQARARLPRHAPNAAAAWLSSIEAVAHAAAHDRRGTAAALLAGERFLTAEGEDGTGAPLAWPWVSPFTFAKASLYRASCAALLGDSVEVARAFREAQPALQAPKRRALALVDVAGAHARRGDLGEACRYATEALDLGQRSGSRRVVQLVSRFRSTLGRKQHPAAAELDDRLARAYL